MVDSLNSKFSIFDLIVYIIPGFILISFFIFTLPNAPIPESYFTFLIVLVLSFLIGNIAHEFSFVPTQLIWSIYHILKEKDEDGHGKKNPRFPWGKTAMLIRNVILDSVTSIALYNQANQLVHKSFNMEKKDKLGIYYIKEILFASTPPICQHFSYLYNQELFSKSMSVVFLIIGVFSLLYESFNNFAFYYQAEILFDYPSLGFIVTLFSFIFILIFVRRYRFFAEYRKQIVNAHIINFLGDKHE